MDKKITAESGGNEDIPSQSNSTSPSKPTAIVDDPELDALLNDALLDFDKPPPLPKAKVQPNRGGPNLSQNGNGLFSETGTNDEMNQVWTEEFIKEATSQFEKKMRECLQAQGMAASVGGASGPSSLSSISGNLNKVVEAATKAAVGDVVEPTGMTSQINEALKGFGASPESLLGDNSGFSENDLAKLMNSFAMGDNADEAEMDEILPFMTNFMQKLLSKDLLYPVLCDIVDRYPEWLADNRQKISNEDFDKYNRQYEFMKKICEEYSSEQASDSAEVKRQRFDRISELMLKVQCTGPPPKELVGEEGGLPGIDPSAALGFGGDQCSIV